MLADRQTDRQTDTVITILRSLTGGGVTITRKAALDQRSRLDRPPYHAHTHCSAAPRGTPRSASSQL